MTTTEDPASRSETRSDTLAESVAGAAGPTHLPGDRSRRAMLERLIRVDQAGEYGAVRIYEGQMAVLGRRTANAAVLKHMRDQELVHLETFNGLIRKRRVRPTAMTPVWHVMGFALGAGTALMGEKAAMACTVAVEEAIDGHYKGQADQLGDDESDLRDTIERFRAEELEHRDIGLRNGAEEAPAFPLLSRAIKGGSRLAIWVSERL
ncbi:demethoxyubiquinone hydroxylase family protein [Roseospira marina]|uniref:3-demethoxyubiquinol 3-hydroxylase n=2 Tax=Roseospira marina TaxID=140057 RepID=A0A5M6I946_9PROT|nr:demethoxyubiquinone hydroxylase family protein [Roseospira marina]MBB4315129.1 ubiquinone biosynthesis monooxygenase Coq7 [Roseospira marina]MBB5088101.1 ubiquinone biosynthesis monooxygenase Coq7 [Roseospira marina]